MSTTAVGAERAIGRRKLTWSGPEIPPWAIVLVATVVCGAAGRYIGEGRTKYAVAIVLGAVFAPLALFDVATALALWVTVLFVQDLRTLSSAPNAIGVIVGLAWLGAFVARSGRLEVVRRYRMVLLLTLLFCIWVTLSIAWAQSPRIAASQAGYYWLSAAALAVVLTAAKRDREVLVIALAFVLGAALSAAIGLANGNLNTAQATTNTVVNGRLSGGAGDPNRAAAAYVAAMFVAVGLLGFYRRAATRVAIGLVLALITVAFIATKSRGGLFALAAAALAALVLSRGQRRRVLGLVALVCAIGAITLAAVPGSLSRITDFSGGSSGRSDIWRVATLIFDHHPIIGVGANNFSVVEPNYVLDITNATRVNYIAETPALFPAHNSYLQFLADTGVVGLVAYLAVIGVCLRCGWRAIRLFEATRRSGHAQLTRAVMMGTIGFLTANFFITDGWDWRLWILLGLSPALLGIARAGPRPARAHV
jgi:O-antigen ligase